MSMDRRQPVNKLLIGIVQDPELPIFGEGANRVEFLSDSLGKVSAKLFSFKAVRYVTGTALIGTSQRSGAGWDKAVNAKVKDEEAATRTFVREFWM